MFASNSFVNVGLLPISFLARIGRLTGGEMTVDKAQRSAIELEANTYASFVPKPVQETLNRMGSARK